MSLILKDVVKRVGAETHIYPCSLELAPEGFNILLGTTLSGKTSLMHLMAGLERPTSGEVWFDGEDVTGVSVQKRNVSMVHQQFINYPNFTVYENIASPLRVTHMAREDVDKRVREIADLLQLTPMLERRPSQLSGGQQQRTALARALVKDADLVLLDEPLANLDFKLREELRDELPKLFAGRKCTVVYATTEPSEALLLGGHTATLHEGRVTQFGPTAALYRQPGDLLSAQVFSDPPINVATVRKRGTRFHLTEQVSWPVPKNQKTLPDGSYTIGTRPHLISPVRTSKSAVKIEGDVLITELSGSETVIHFDLGQQTWISQSHGIHPFEVGERVAFYAELAKSMYFDREGKLL